MHCAAQSYSGYLSMLVMVQKYKMSPNITDNFNATPLHFAIIHKEFKNVELLIKLGADVNA
jgi:ankyrin repeat protein